MEQSLSVAAYKGDNPLLKHGFLRVSAAPEISSTPTARRSFGWVIRGGRACANG